MDKKKEIVLKIENVSKQYRLGLVGTGTLTDDLKRWWYKVRGKEDPFLKVGVANDRTKKSDSQYVWALQDINFEVEKGEVLGIIGKNGAGKSTLLKLLSKVADPTIGSIKYKGRIAALLEVGTGFHPELTGRNNIYLNGAVMGMKKHEIDAKIDEIIEFSGVANYIDTPVKRYSSGMKVRLGFAVAAHLEPDILIVDEVLAVGDAEFQAKCIGKMKDVAGEGRTVLFVSHNMGSVKDLCSRVILIENGKITLDDETEKVLEIYQSNNVSKGTIKLIERLDREGTGDIIVEEIKLMNNNKVEVDSFFSFDSMFIEFKLNRTITSDSNLVLAFSIIDVWSNQVLMWVTDEFSNGISNNIINNNTFVFKMPTINLRPSEYFIGFQLCENVISKVTTLDRVETAKSFSILSKKLDPESKTLREKSMAHSEMILLNEFKI
jgi:lipopolysaccharide transport system ATP-binding protein